MSPARRADPDLDSLIEEITVDCYNADEQLTAFENAFYDASFACPGTVVGEDVEVLSVSPVSASRRRRSLVARSSPRSRTCCRYPRWRQSAAALAAVGPRWGRFKPSSVGASSDLLHPPEAVQVFTTPHRIL
jgi:hypothetical protein